MTSAWRADEQDRRFRALAAAGLLLAAAVAAGSAGAEAKPEQGAKVTGLTCVERCAGPESVAAGGTIRLHGRGLGGTSAVSFTSAAGTTSVANPAAAANGHSIEVDVPTDAVAGKVSAVDASGVSRPAPHPLRVVADSQLPPPGRFKLTSTAAKPRRAFFDGRSVKLHYRFAASGSRDVQVQLRRHGHVVKSWSERGSSPFARHSVAWDGMREDGGAGLRGRYEFRVSTGGSAGGKRAGFRFFDHIFPVRAGHSYGDRFGVPRSGGRVHQGQDVWAHCGSPLVAARGGKVQARSYSGALYGFYVVIDQRKSNADYMYAHMLPNVRVHQGETVHTGQRIGSVGKTGNARGEGCQLHFEYWPGGRPQGHPIDPLPLLRRWDRWS